MNIRRSPHVDNQREGFAGVPSLTCSLASGWKIVGLTIDGNRMYVPLSSNVSATAPTLPIAEDDGRGKELVEGVVRSE